MNYDDLLRELKMEAVSFPDISAEDLSNIIHALENHFCKAINDVEPGRHGRWINHLCEDGVMDGIFCSQCNYETDRNNRPNYCPNCGAKMISEVNIRENIKAALKAAGWSDDTINTFLNPDIEVVNPVSTSTYIPNAFPDEVDVINLPLMDSTSVTITQLVDADEWNNMTKQDAIKSLEKLRSFHSGSYAKAIDMAIEAMELEVVMCKDCRFRRGEKKNFCYGIEKYTIDDDFCSRGERGKDE